MVGVSVQLAHWRSNRTGVRGLRCSAPRVASPLLAWMPKSSGRGSMIRKVLLAMIVFGEVFLHGLGLSAAAMSLT